jgi:hypothetical protein
VLAAGCSAEELLAWSAALHKPSKITPTETRLTNEQNTILNQQCIIDELIELNKQQAVRFSALEAQFLTQNSVVQRKQTATPATSSILCNSPPTKRRKAGAASLLDVWFEWYTKEPRLWHTTNDRQKKSDAKLIVGYLKLFCIHGIYLVETDDKYRDEVLNYGRNAENAALSFLNSNSLSVKGAGSVLRSFRKLHKSGALNNHIRAYNALLATSKIVDPTPTFCVASFCEIVQQNELDELDAYIL